MNISGPAAVAKPEMLFYAPGDLTVTVVANTEIAGHGGLVAAVSGCFIFALVILLKNFVSSNY